MADSVTVRSVDWKTVFPAGVLLYRAAAKSFQPLVILTGAAGVLLVRLGWWLSALIFLGGVVQPPHSSLQPLKPSAADSVPSLVDGPVPQAEFIDRANALVSSAESHLAGVGALERLGLPHYFLANSGPIEPMFLKFWIPALDLYSSQTSITTVGFVAFGMLWQLAVWALVGGIIVRKSLVELATEESYGFMDAVQFTLRRYVYFFTAPLFPIGGVILLAVPFALLGLLMRFDLGVLIAGLFWIIVMLAGLAAAWLLVALFFAWPLLWGAVAAEPDGDHFGAVSRMFAYLYQRPLHYLFYVAIIAVLGGLAAVLVHAGVETTTHFGKWSTSWGAGHAQISAIELPPANRATLHTGATLIGWAEAAVRLLADGWAVAFFWSGFAGVYLLMRKATDDKETDEVYLDYDDAPPTPPTLPVPPPSASASPSAPPPPPAAPALTAELIPPPPEIPPVPPATPVPPPSTATENVQQVVTFFPSEGERAVDPPQPNNSDDPPPA